MVLFSRPKVLYCMMKGENEVESISRGNTRSYFLRKMISMMRNSRFNKQDGII
jgi:hypothetical protein